MRRLLTARAATALAALYASAVLCPADAKLAACNVGVYTIAGNVSKALFPLWKAGSYNGIAADLEASRTRRLYWNEYQSSPAIAVIRFIDENGGFGVYTGSLTAQGSNDGTLATSTFNTIHSMIVDPTNGDLYTSDSNGYKIRRVTSSGATTVAGTNAVGCAGDGNVATVSGSQAQNVMAMVRDPDTGNINFMGASPCHRGRTLTTGGMLASWIGVTSGGVYGGNNGPATAATFNYPNGLAMYRDPVTNAKHWYIAVSCCLYSLLLADWLLAGVFLRLNDCTRLCCFCS